MCFLECVLGLCSEFVGGGAQAKRFRKMPELEDAGLVLGDHDPKRRTSRSRRSRFSSLTLPLMEDRDREELMRTKGQSLKSKKVV